MKNSILMKSGIPLIIVLVAFIAATVMIKSRKPPEQVPVEIPAFLVEAGLNVEDLQALNVETNKKVGKKRPVKYKLVDSKGEEHLWTGIGRMPRVYKEALDSGKSLDDYAIN